MKSSKLIFIPALLVVAGATTAFIGGSSQEESKADALTRAGAQIFHIKDGKRMQGGFIDDSTDLLPSFIGCGQNLASTDQWEFQCGDCYVTFNLEEGTEDGGHSSSTHSARPLGQLTSHLEGVAYHVTGSAFVTYQAPNNSGEARLKTTWTFPSAPSTTSYVSFYVYVPDLQDLSGSSYFTTNNITSHPGNGTYMNYDAGVDLIAALDNYQTDSASAGVPSGSIVKPNSEALSLQYGGLFDINKNFSNPHCQHRAGLDIDIGMANFQASAYEGDLTDALKTALANAGYVFPNLSESPDATPAEQSQSGYHWHAHYNN